MAVKFEELGKNKVKITFEVSAERFEEGVEQAYRKNKSKMNIPGFRQGKAPRKFIEASFGKNVFYEDAVNIVLPNAYEAAITELNLETVSRPEIDIDEISAETGLVISAEVFVKPSVELADYKSITYKKADTDATEDEIIAEIDKAREKNARILSIEDRAVQDGDTTIIDFEGFVDDVPFEGGAGTDYELVIGSGTFIDTFESQLIGKEIGQQVDVNVTFPENYGKEDLIGKPALFKVTVKEIKSKELPEMNDEFAQDVSEFDTLDEYKNDLKSKIEVKKTQDAERDKEEQVINALLELAEVDIPEPMITSRIDEMVRDFSQRLQMQGMQIETYLMYTGMDEEALKQSYRANAEKNVKARLCLEKVADTEAFDVSDEEFDGELERMSAAYNIPKERLVTLVRDEEKKGIIKDIKVQKALKALVDSAIEIQ